MAYATLAQLRGPDGRLDQFTLTAGVSDKDTLLTECLNEANGLVNSAIGAATTLTAAASSTRVLYGDGGLYLSSDIPMSTVTSVTTLSGHTVPSYVLLDGVLRITDSTGILIEPWYPALGGSSWPYSSGWTRNLPYTVIATFGLSASDIAILRAAELDAAVQIFRYKDAGGSETIGADAAIITVRAGWSPLIREGLESIRRRLMGNSVGVH